MSRKAETMYTSRMLNKAAHEKKTAVRNARRQIAAFEQFCLRNSGKNVASYFAVNGIVMPNLCEN